MAGNKLGIEQGYIERTTPEVKITDREILEMILYQLRQLRLDLDEIGTETRLMYLLYVEPYLKKSKKKAAGSIWSEDDDAQNDKGKDKGASVWQAGKEKKEEEDLNIQDEDQAVWEG